MTQFYEEAEADPVLTSEDMRNLAEGGGKPADTLMNVVALIAARFRTDVCSAYLLEPDRSNLVLAATLGLHPRCIGTLAHAAQRRACRAGGRAVAAGGRRRRDASIRATSTSRNRAKRSTTRFWACR